MKMKRILYITLAVIALSAGVLQAQDRTDALRWSQYFYDGTARFSAMGGAFGALGGDVSSLSVNPAGIGVYRSTEFSFTPAYISTNTKSAFTNQPAYSQSKGRGNFNFGYVQPFIMSDDNEGLVSLQIGFASNTMSNHNYNSYVEQNTGSSWLDALRDKMENRWEYFDPADMEGDNRYYNYGPGDWDALLGWNSSLINKDSIGFYNALGLDDILNQRRLVESKGRNTEFAISFGGNYANTLFFGLTVGMHDIEYRKYITHSEDVMEPTTTDLMWFDYTQYFETQGHGFNLKFGLMYRLNDNWRFGFAVHTPTWLSLKDYYQASMHSEFESDTQYFEPDVTPTNEYEYKITTPARYNLSAAYLFGSLGAVSLDYEYVDYSTMKMKDRHAYNRDSFLEENEIIKNEFAGTSNIRFGVEIKPAESFAIRAGYAFYGSPYKNSVEGGDPTTQIISLGLGYRTDGFFIDAAYKYLTSKSGLYSIYDGSNTISEKYNTNQFALTVGFRF